MEKPQSSIAAARAARRVAREKEDLAQAKNHKRKGRIQITLGVLVLIGFIAVGYVLDINVSSKSSMMWIFGILFGVTLQRSRFCFTAAVRDPTLTGATSLAKSVIIAIAITTAGFAAIHFAKGGDVVLSTGAYYFIKPVGLHTAVGAFMFGIGMVIAGGCASGTLMRIGEGFVMQMITLCFFIVGVVLGIMNRSFWKETISFDPVHFPEKLGWFFALCLQYALLLTIFLLVEVVAKKTKMKKSQ